MNAIGLARALVVGLAVLAATGEAAAIPVRPSLEELCEKANLIVVARVSRVEARWQRFSYGTIIVTDAILEVEGVVHGRIERFERIALTVKGGSLEGKNMASSDDPFLRENDRFVFVLHEPDGSRRSRRGVSVGGKEQPGAGRIKLIGGSAGAVRLDPTAPLPDDDELSQIWRRVCVPGPPQKDKP